MPAYSNTNPPVSLQPGLPLNAIVTADPVATGFAGQQAALAPRGGVTGHRVRLEGTFSGAPGTFEVDAQEATIDNPNNYSTVGTGATAVNANNGFSIDLINVIAGQFIRPYVKTLTNSVTLQLTMVEQP